eukprot:7086182-Alexandrium_andersonii.AAC.1
MPTRARTCTLACAGARCRRATRAMRARAHGDAGSARPGSSASHWRLRRARAHACARSACP